MKYLRSFLIILAISFVGELCHQVIPAPIPASIYGMVILFLLLLTRVLPLELVKDAGHFLVEIMAVLFVCPAVGLLASWELFREQLLAITIITVVSLLVTFAVSGLVTQAIVRRKGEKRDA